MEISKEKVCYILASAILFSTCTSVFAMPENIPIEKTQSTISTEEIFSYYPDAVKVEFVSNEGTFSYFRIYKKHGSRNYILIQYNNDLKYNFSKIKELVWIWGKTYESEIRDIQFENLGTDNINAKVYLRNGKIINEKITFVDNPTQGEYLHFIYCSQT